MFGKKRTIFLFRLKRVQIIQGVKVHLTPLTLTNEMIVMQSVGISSVLKVSKKGLTRTSLTVICIG